MEAVAGPCRNSQSGSGLMHLSHRMPQQQTSQMMTHPMPLKRRRNWAHQKKFQTCRMRFAFVQSHHKGGPFGHPMRHLRPCCLLHRCSIDSIPYSLWSKTNAVSGDLQFFVPASARSSAVPAKCLCQIYVAVRIDWKSFARA